MSNELEDFIEVLNEGLKNYLNKNNFSVDKNFYDQLEKKLYQELRLIME